MRDPKSSPEARLIAGLIALKLDPALAAPLLRYLGELVLWNKAYNLTSVREPAEMVTRHLLDSLVLLPHLKAVGAGHVGAAHVGAAHVGAAHGRDSMRLIDVGTGAGLPGIPLAIANPALHVTLLDSNGKKARFLRHAQRQLPLTNVEVVEARAEAYVPPAPFDAVVSRAFAALGDFLKATARLSGNGRWLAMKGKLDEQELAAVPPGFRVEQAIPLKVPGLDEERHLVKVVSSRGA
jgi:16S rRNA (guanine527-N7)-methyltransferase